MSVIGHNNPPEERPKAWEKQYFYMPVSEAEAVIALLEAFKNTFPFPDSNSARKMTRIIDDRVTFLQKKIGNHSTGGQS